MSGKVIEYIIYISYVFERWSFVGVPKLFHSQFKVNRQFRFAISSQFQREYFFMPKNPPMQASMPYGT